MCERLIGVFAGRPLMFTTKLAVAAVMLPDESRVTSIVIVEFPPPPASVPVIGGTSLFALSNAENTNLFCGVGLDGLSSPQPAAASTASAIVMAAAYFIG